VRFGISTRLYRNERLSRAHLEDVAGHGFEAVELYATRPHFDYHDARAIDELAGWLDQTGLTLHAIHAPVAERLAGGQWVAPYSTAHADPTERSAAMTALEAVLHVATRIETRCLVLHLGVPSVLAPAPGVNDPRAACWAVEQVATLVAPLGMQAALEVIPNELSTPERLAALLEEQVDAPAVGVCLDVGHAFLLGDLVDGIEALSGHLVTVHLHDNDGRVDEHLVPFDGSVDWPPALMALQKLGYADRLIFELEPNGSPRASLETARRARRQIERMLAS